MTRTESEVVADTIVALMDARLMGKDNRTVSRVLEHTGLNKDDIAAAARRHIDRGRRAPIPSRYDPSLVPAGVEPKPLPLRDLDDVIAMVREILPNHDPAEPEVFAAEVFAAMTPPERERFAVARLTAEVTPHLTGQPDIAPVPAPPEPRRRRFTNRLSGPARRQALSKDAFPLPDGRLVPWATATIEDHLARAVWCEERAEGLHAEAYEHREAAQKIRDAGVSCLAELTAA